MYTDFFSHKPRKLHKLREYYKKEYKSFLILLLIEVQLAFNLFIISVNSLSFLFVSFILYCSLLSLIRLLYLNRNYLRFARGTPNVKDLKCDRRLLVNFPTERKRGGVDRIKWTEHSASIDSPLPRISMHSSSWPDTSRYRWK